MAEIEPPHHPRLHPHQTLPTLPRDPRSVVVREGSPTPGLANGVLQTAFPEVVARTHLGVPEEEFKRIVLAQGGAYAICRAAFDGGRTGTIRLDGVSADPWRALSPVPCRAGGVRRRREPAPGGGRVLGQRDRGRVVRLRFRPHDRVLVILFRRRSQQCSIGSFTFGVGCSIGQRLRLCTTVRISDAGECRSASTAAGTGPFAGSCARGARLASERSAGRGTAPGGGGLSARVALDAQAQAIHTGVGSSLKKGSPAAFNSH